MQRENKWQDRFDERFNVTKYYEGTMKISNHNMVLGKIKSFIQSEIDLAVAEERAEVVKQWKKANEQKDGSAEGMNKMWAKFDDFIDLIK
jgi:hypothetical protein